VATKVQAGLQLGRCSFNYFCLFGFGWWIKSTGERKVQLHQLKGIVLPTFFRFEVKQAQEHRDALIVQRLL